MTIIPGAVTPGTITDADPHCFLNWDSSGRCRQYELRPAIAGRLVATLRVSTPPRGAYGLELFLAADGTWLWAPESWPERSAHMPAVPGEPYRLVVLGYGPFPEPFEVVAEIEQ